MGSSADRIGRIAGPAVVLLAGALSTIWAFVVPIFQGPDEPAHFDYAMSIYGAQRLIRIADGQTDWIVSPYATYLMRVADQERIAWHSSMRVPAGYLTPAYVARVDAGAPDLHARLAPQGRISYLVPAYPFGFYAIEALWLRAVSLFTGSLVALFFAARLLCVFLTMLGLYFNFRTALNLGLRPAPAAALTAAIGFFPLTSMVSSYVQPDNLSYALVSAALFFATRLRPGSLHATAIGALGLSLGLLAVTKYQFFLAVALPVVPLVGVRLMQARPTSWQRLVTIAQIAAPPAILLAVQHWVVGQTAALGRPSEPSDMNLDYFRSLIAAGPLPTLMHVAGAAGEAFVGCFVRGSCAASFWQVVGWVDTPIVIVNPGVEYVLRAVIGLASFAVAALLAFTIGRNALRLLRAALRGRTFVACTIAVADPVLSAYAAFLALMLALYIITNNAFGAEGRQLYPFIFAAFLCFVWYAPRALRRRHARLSAAAAGLLAAYSLVASGYALAGVLGRYYGPQTARYITTTARHVADANAGVLWPVVSADYHVASSRFTFAFPRGSRLLADGSAVLPSGEVPQTVAVVLDGATPLPVLAGQYLYPVAEAARDLQKGYSGFYATIHTDGLAEGPHAVTAYAATADGRTFDRIEPPRLFFLTNPDGRFSRTFLARLAGTASVPGSLEPAGACRGHAGAVLLLRGSDGIASRDVESVWLLADGRPFPARFDAGNGSFTGAIPATAVAPGSHVVAAFASTHGSAGISRIAATTYVTTNGLQMPKAACADPLRQLQGT